MTELKKSSKSKKPNFQQNLDKILLNLTNSTHFSSQNQHFSQFNNIPQQKPTLLLHACCGPCSSYVLEYLVKYFQITVFYYNPNIYPPAEYERRFEELKNLYIQNLLPFFSILFFICFNSRKCSNCRKNI